MSVKADISFLMKGLRSKCLLLNSLRWSICSMNSVDNTKLPCYSLPPTQHHSLFRNLPPLFMVFIGLFVHLGITIYTTKPLTQLL